MEDHSFPWGIGVGSWFTALVHGEQSKRSGAVCQFIVDASLPREDYFELTHYQIVRVLAILALMKSLLEFSMPTTLTKKRTKRNSVASPQPTLNGATAPAAIQRVDWASLSFTIPANAVTLAGFRQWRNSAAFPQEGRVSFLGGEIFIDMSWERLDSHNQVKAVINYVLYGRAVEKDLGKYYPDGAGVVNVDANVANVPDGVFVSWESFETNRVRKIPGSEKGGDYLELEGTPDWVMEIVSPSSVAKDTTKLLGLNHRAKIPEYWLLDARGDEVSFQIFTHGPQDYVPQPSKGGWQFSPVFAASFRLTRTKDRLGGWEYHLETKESKKR